MDKKKRDAMDKKHNTSPHTLKVKDLTPHDTDVKGGATAASTPKLMQAATKGTHIPEITIELW